ncbi:MAG: LysM peptidoglycan-binding domain-containing protein [Opitutales bacterium]|nr:LysM peptidoglycan-binding domain-containing protein [Opitutales bacterium]
MKLSQIFGLVVLIHLGIVAALLIQPGCQTQRPADPDPSMTTQAAPTAGNVRSANDRTSPARPVDAHPGEVDPAFNAGFQPSARRSEPMRPVSPTTAAPARTEGRTDVTGGGVLRPLTPVDPAANDRPFSSDAPSAPSQTYTVQRGDNLTVIARRFNVGLNELLAANNLRRDSTIFAGQELTIPAPAREATPSGPASVPADGREARYTVQAGDTLTRIANRFGVTVAEIRSANGLTSDTIRVGDTLRIPGVAGTTAGPAASPPSPATAPRATASGETYTVQRGDTPITIARRLGVSAEELMRVNSISDPRRLFVGQELIVPSGGRAPASSAPARTPPPAPPAPRTTTPPAAETVPLRPQPSQPARITPPPPTLDDLDALDDDDLPFVDVETIPPRGDD